MEPGTTTSKTLEAATRGAYHLAADFRARHAVNLPLTWIGHSPGMSRSPSHTTPALAKSSAWAAIGLALTAALLLVAVPARADIDFAAAQRIALTHVPGQIESIVRSYGMFRVGVRGGDGVKYEVRIDRARGSVQRVRPVADVHPARRPCAYANGRGRAGPAASSCSMMSTGVKVPSVAQAETESHKESRTAARGVAQGDSR